MYQSLLKGERCWVGAQIHISIRKDVNLWIYLEFIGKGCCLSAAIGFFNVTLCIHAGD